MAMMQRPACAMLVALGALCASDGARADLRPSPERRNQPYLEALQKAGRTCAAIESRDYIADAALDDLDQSRWRVTCTGGRRYMMVVKSKPRPPGRRRARIDSFDVISIRQER